MLHKLGRTERQEQRCQTAHPEENLRHSSHYPYIFIGHFRHRDPIKRSHTLTFDSSSPRPKTDQQSIPIGHALGNGLVQPSFRSPSRRSPSDCSPSHFRRVAGLKLLCIMFYSRGRTNTKQIVSFHFKGISVSRLSRYRASRALIPFMPCRRIFAFYAGDWTRSKAEEEGAHRLKSKDATEN